MLIVINEDIIIEIDSFKAGGNGISLMSEDSLVINRIMDIRVEKIDIPIPDGFYRGTDVPSVSCFSSLLEDGMKDGTYVSFSFLNKDTFCLDDEEFLSYQSKVRQYKLESLLI